MHARDRNDDVHARADDLTRSSDNGEDVAASKPESTEASKCDEVMKDSALKDTVTSAMPASERDAIIKKFVDELEDWKEMQQQMYKVQLKRKEDYHLELLASEWSRRRGELEHKLRGGVERCRQLAAQLAAATQDLQLRAFRSTARENKLLEAKKALEAHYTSKFQELREASQKMEADMNHQLRLKELAVEEERARVQSLEKQIDVLKRNLMNIEKEAESRCSGLTKDQTASLIQELRCLEEKLESAVQSKSFFKEQWGRAVRELHLMKLAGRRQVLARLRSDRRRLSGPGADLMEEREESGVEKSEMDINKLKDDFYMDILANTPTVETHSVMSKARRAR
ncbi:centrosomal protein of 120 kDa [Leptidea sinapis]|uniref:centrosomal protein of 120 kDa n=1 Tax=Leptidea sinapis TaxID=189913 RepID=UPI0021C49CEA|nr:centrosomal protein of 120 kDa [Leptidea sinapis]